MKNILGTLALGCVLVCPHADAQAFPRAEVCNAMSVYAFATAYARDNGLTLANAVSVARNTGESDDRTADVQESIVRDVYAVPHNPPSKEAVDFFRACMKRSAPAL